MRLSPTATIIMVAVCLISMLLAGCLWLAIPELGYEGYEYHKGKGSLYAATHPKDQGQHHATPAPTPELE